MKIRRLDPKPYALQTVERACDVLSCFQSDNERLRLKDIVERTALDTATVFRILKTLAGRGFLEAAGKHHYRSCVRLFNKRRRTIGYAAESTEFAFSREVTESIRQAAEREQIDLLEFDNRYSRTRALKNANLFIRQRVDLVLEFQVDERFAPVLSALYQQAGIPVVAIEIPHPGATYFGANNYMAGLIGGRFLGRWTQKHWDGIVEELVLLELPRAGPVPASRLTGALDGLREVLPSAAKAKIVRLNGNGQFGRSLEAVRKHLRNNPQRQTLVAAINDPSAIGALRAFEECGRQEHCAVVGQNASIEARAEMRRPGTRLVGSVAYSPERYGEQIMHLALKILEKRHVPPAVFVEHKLITPQTVNREYPNDTLLSAGELDTLMLQSSGSRAS
jgi:ribose transport system substrate-binding protein